MDYINHNTSFRTSKQLSYEEYFYIKKRLQAKAQSITNTQSSLLSLAIRLLI